MANRFYTNLPIMRGEVVLDGTEAHHLTAVSRHRPGDRVCLFNGDGQDYPAEIVSIGKRNVVLQVLDAVAVSRELPFPLQVAAPLPKGDRGDFLIEKLTEIGVSSFVPLRTRRSVVEPRDTKLDRLRQRVIEASKQCGRNVLMDVRPLVDWETYLGDVTGVCLLAHPNGEAMTPLPSEAITVAVGPEGGFAPEEIDAAMAAGWRLVNLGPRILRVETAAIVLAGWVAMNAGQ